MWKLVEEGGVCGKRCPPWGGDVCRVGVGVGHEGSGDGRGESGEADGGWEAAGGAGVPHDDGDGDAGGWPSRKVADGEGSEVAWQMGRRARR